MLEELVDEVDEVEDEDEASFEPDDPEPEPFGDGEPLLPASPDPEASPDEAPDAVEVVSLARLSFR